MHCFLQIADNIRAKQSSVKSTPKRIISLWVIIFAFLLLLSPIIDYSLHQFFSPYGLGWLLFAGMAGLGGLGGFVVVVTLANARTYHALEANLSDIRTLLKFNTIIKIMPETKDGTKKKSN